MEKRSLFGLEVAVSLTDRNRLSDDREESPFESAKIAVFRHFGVINQALATDPTQEDLLLFLGRTEAKLVAVHHNSMIHSRS